MGVLKEQSDLVTIIITTFNRSNYLEITLDSIIEQSYSNIEVIVIDDGSNIQNANNNRRIVDSKDKCYYYYKNNSGQPDSRNFGISKANGRYIAFCDDDDIWVSNKIELQLQIFEKNLNVFVVTGDIGFINQEGEKLNRVKSHFPDNHGNVFLNFLSKNRTSSITPILKKEVFKEVGLFNPNFKIAEDWEFWRRVSYCYQFFSLNHVLAYVRLHNETMSSKKDNTPLGNIKVYNELTKSLIIWGKSKFSITEIRLIRKIEWSFYKRLINNHYPGLLNKFVFFVKILRYNIHFTIHLIWLGLRYEF